MRILFLISIFFCFASAKAQTPLFFGGMNYNQAAIFNSIRLPGDSNRAVQPWHFSTYGALSTGVAFYPGGGGSFVAAPVGIQVNRRLNNNVYAFAGVSVAPTLYNFNHSFMNSGFHSGYPGNTYSNAYGAGLYSRAELGLMYVNDARTFSISGSIGIERSTNPAFPAGGMNTQTQQPVTRTRK